MTVRILVGDALAQLRTLPDESVQCCVTSPPYWGLRDYGVAGQIGLERTPDEYVARMVDVFREVKRVLRKDGTLWLNIGDSYAGSTMTGGNKSFNASGGGDGFKQKRQFKRPSVISGDCKPKDLVGIPWMLAFALRADGWYLRSDIIWAKPNPMPESVTDRPTKAHEYVFLLSKSASYFYDADAIAEPSGGWNESEFHDGKNAIVHPNVGRNRAREAFNGEDAVTRKLRGHTNHLGTDATRNKRSVWNIATQPFKESHFATMPPELAETCIKAGSAKQACEHCGAPWERVVERTPAEVRSPRSDYGHGAQRNDGGRSQLIGAKSDTLGFAPSCSCESNTGSARSVVLDPFGGAGTTGLVADRLERDAILVELNPEYAAMAERRIRGDNPMFTQVEVA